MNYRRLGKTQLKVSEIGFGSWQLGNCRAWGPMDDKTALSLVYNALDQGCTLFDTAPNYAETNSERLLGEALRGRRQDVVLVSKFGHRPAGDADFTVEWMWESLHGTLKRLQTDFLDVLLLHSPPDEYLDGFHPIWEALRQAQKRGHIRFYGASTDHAYQVRRCLDTSDAQVLELLFNVLHQDVRLAFDRIKDRQVGVITKVPLDSGWLTGKYNAKSRFEGVRSRWDLAEIQKRAELIAQLGWPTEDNVPMSQKAIGFLLSYPEVSCVIPGIRTQKQLSENLFVSGKPLSLQDRKRLEEFWDLFTDRGEKLLPW